ncbi:serine hydrolase domain-containing protein, partial [Fulvivirga lutimaris]|uniref:serine hydrolase domain-containing protein n=1 Tax=Fulvivirga lutimaris TaxID=1819566 RepID=UPI0012BC1F63
MKIFNILFICIYTISGFYHPAFGQSDVEKLDAYFLKKMKQSGIIGLQVGMVREGKFVWQGSYGKVNNSTGQLVNDSTLFMIASSSKPVTALGILKLCSDGQLNLDDPINKYLPFSITNPYNPTVDITIRMLLSHVGGFKDNWGLLDPLYTVQEGGDSPIALKDLVSKYFTPGREYYDSALNFSAEPPGKIWAYSNMGYATLGYIIECITGKSFDQYMQEEIFGPLGMNNSYWFLRNIPHNNIARPHVLADNKDDSIRVLPHYGYPDYPDGQLRTTVKDYAKTIELIFNDGKVGGSSFIKPEL